MLDIINYSLQSYSEMVLSNGSVYTNCRFLLIANRFVHLRGWLGFFESNQLSSSVAGSMDLHNMKCQVPRPEIPDLDYSLTSCIQIQST